MKQLLRKRIFSTLLAIALIVPLLASLQSPTYAASLPFTDVPTNHQYYDSIAYVYENGIMQGTSSTQFSPGLAITRAMIVTILYRADGSTMKRTPTGFTDVTSTAYYYYAVGWAQYYGIVNGITDTEFAPNAAVTRQQAITFLYRYAVTYKGYSYNPTGNLVTSLTDYSTMHNYAKVPVNWALNCGVLPSNTSTLGCTSNLPRGMCANYLHRMCALVLGDGKSYAQSSLSISRASDIQKRMEAMGYTSNLWYDVTKVNMEYSLYNSNILYSHSHGGPNCIRMSDGLLYAYNIDSNMATNMELTYISACYAGDEFCRTLYETGGAQAVVGFKDTVAASTDRDGIHTFNYYVFFLVTGDELETAIRRAQDSMYDYYGELYGADSVEWYGHFEKMD